MLTSSRTVVRLVLALLFGQGILGCETETIEPASYGALEGTALGGSNKNTPLANVVITTNPATTSFTTEAQGRFSLPNLLVRKTESVNVQVDAGGPTLVTVVLEKASGTNRRPNAPFNPVPATGATAQPVHLTLKWRVTDPDAGDSLKSDVIIYESNSLDQKQVLTNSRDTTVTVDLKFNTTYFWQATIGRRTEPSLSTPATTACGVSTGMGPA
jgi:TolB protein